MTQFEERKAKLEHYWAEYNEVQSRLELLDEAEDWDQDDFEKVTSMRYPPRSASTFRRHCERPFFPLPSQVFATPIVVRTFDCLS